MLPKYDQCEAFRGDGTIIFLEQSFVQRNAHVPATGSAHYHLHPQVSNMHDTHAHRFTCNSNSCPGEPGGGYKMTKVSRIWHEFPLAHLANQFYDKHMHDGQINHKPSAKLTQSMGQTPALAVCFLWRAAREGVSEPWDRNHQHVDYITCLPSHGPKSSLSCSAPRHRQNRGNSTRR